MPRRLAAATHRDALIEASDEQVLFRIPGTGRYLIDRYGPVGVEREPGAGDADVTCFLRGPVGAAYLLWRGALAVRAAAVSVTGAGVLICGGSASGKSTLAAALAMRGHAVLADRVATLRLTSDGSAVSCDPLDRAVGVWPDMAERLGLDPILGRTVRPALPLREWSLGPPEPATAPVRAVVVLRARPQERRPVTEPMGAARLHEVAGQVWHPGLVAHAGRVADQFRLVTALAQVGRLVVVDRFRGGWDGPEAIADLVTGLVT